MPPIRLSKEWHLAKSEHEVAMTELEFAIMRVAATFEQWQSDCMGCCESKPFSGTDVATLHVVRMHDRPKSISEIRRLMRRDDLSTLQYGLRKLAKAGLIEKLNGGRGSKKDTSYQVTERGYQLSEDYAAYRRELLLSITPHIGDENKLDEVTQSLNHLSGLYDQAARVAATYRV